MKIVFLMVALVLLGVICCKKDENNKLEECLDEAGLEVKISVGDLEGNFEDVRLGNGELDTSKFYMFFFDGGVKKVIPFRYEFGNDKERGSLGYYYKINLYFTDKEDIKRMYSLKREKVYIKDVCGVITYEAKATQKENCKRVILEKDQWFDGVSNGDDDLNGEPKPIFKLFLYRIPKKNH